MFREKITNKSSFRRMSVNIRAVVFLGFILYPVYFMPLFLGFISKGERWPYILISLFIGSLAYLIIPIEGMDITRYYDTFNAFQDPSFDFYNITQYFTHSVMWILWSIGFSKEMIPFVFTVATYLILSKVFFYVIDEYKLEFLHTPRRLFFLIFGAALFLEVSFMGVASGLRNPLSFSVSLLGLYLIFSKNYTIKGLGFLFLAILIHPSAALFVAIYLIINSIPCLKLYRFLLYISLFILITDASRVIIEYILFTINPLLELVELDGHSSLAIHGVWGGGYWDLISYNSFIYSKFIQPLPFYMAFIYLLFTGSVISDYRKFVYVLFFFVVIFSHTVTLFVRYNIFATIIFTVMIMIEYRVQSFSLFKKLFIIVFVLSLVVTNAANMHKYRYIFGSWLDVLYFPMPMVIMTKERLESGQYTPNIN